MKNKKIILLLSSLIVSSCASAPTDKVENSYSIYDIKTDSVKLKSISDAIVNGFKKETSHVSIQADIPPYPLPKEPARFTLEQPKLKGNLAAFIPQMPKRPVCKNSVLTINAANTGMSSYGENINFFSCLIPYVGGYRLNFYTTYTANSGGIGTLLAQSVVGNESQFIPKTINAVVNNIKSLGVTTTKVDAYP